MNDVLRQLTPAVSEPPSDVTMKIDIPNSDGDRGHDEPRMELFKGEDIPATVVQSYQPEEAKREAAFQPVKLKVGGQEIEISDPQQLVQLAQMGQDYTQKTQSLAEERKQLEQQRIDFQNQMLETQRLTAQLALKNNEASSFIADDDDLVPDPEKFDPAIVKMHQRLVALDSKFKDISQANIQQQTAQAEQYVESIHQREFGRPLNMGEQQRFVTAIKELGINPSNPKALEMVHGMVFMPERLTAAQEKANAQKLADHKAGILSRGVSTGTIPNQRIGAEKYRGRTPADAFDNAAAALKSKYGF